jgi:membrane protease YdiL (CAAX protease family)
VLTARNVAGETFIPSRLYVPVNVAVAGLLLAIAAASRLSLADIGLSPSRVLTGLRVAGVIVVIVAVAIALGAGLPLTRGFFEDQRIAAIDGGGALAYQVLVRIPFGTALLEEVAFRGVLLALLSRHVSTAAAVAISSALFGLWHINPTLSALATNELAPGVLAQTGAVTAAVIFTAIGGALFCGLRLATDSLVAPLVVHAAINSLATLAAYLVLHTE